LGVVPSRQSCFAALAAALFWLCGVLPAHALHAPEKIPISQETRVGDFSKVASGRLSLRDEFGPANTPGSRGCGGEMASGRGKWLSYDPLWNAGDPNGYSFTGGDPVNRTDPNGKCVENKPPVYYMGIAPEMQASLQTTLYFNDGHSVTTGGPGQPAQMYDPNHLGGRSYNVVVEPTGRSFFYISKQPLPANYGQTTVTPITKWDVQLLEDKQFLMFSAVVLSTAATDTERFAPELLAANRLTVAEATMQQATRAAGNVEQIAQSGPAWQSLAGGVRIRQVGNYWIKEVDPNASALAQSWGRGSLNAQANGLSKLGDMAPNFLYQNGKLITRDAGAYTPGNFWGTWWQGTMRLGTPFNDIRPWNIGDNGIIFDPAKNPIQQAAEAGATIGGIGVGGIWLYNYYGGSQ
jgi:hypothetical protein